MMIIMVLETFTRFLLFLTSFNQYDKDLLVRNPNDSSILVPGNLSTNSFFLDSWTNDTVTIENPYFQQQHQQDENNEGNYGGGDTFTHRHTFIKLPICCNSIHPDTVNADGDGGQGANSVCPNSRKDSISGQHDNYNGTDINHNTYAHLGHWYPSSNLFPSVNQSHYKFEVRRPTCRSPLKVIKLSMDEFEVGNQGRFLRNGYFGYNNDEFYSPQEYCISGLTGEFVQLMICESQDCSFSEGRPCIQKCCNPDEIYSFSRRSCIKSKGTLFHPIFYHDLSTKLSESEQENVHPHYHIAFPRSFKYHCMENRTQIFPGGVDFAEMLSNFTNRKYYSAHFKIRKDGKIMYRKDGKAIIMPEGSPVYLQEQNKKCYTLKSSSHYCIDGAAEYGSPNPFNNDEGEMMLVTCSEYLFEKPKMGPLSVVYGNVMITSSVFSFLTVVVYVILKEKHNIHGWTIASYAFSMFLMYIFLGLAHLIRYYKSDDVLKSASCITIGIASHLFSMSSFLWLTLMNWDIWWTFRKFRPSTLGRGRRGREVQHFLTYSIFGWGIPIFITGISTFIHFKYEKASEDDCAMVGVPLPAYGRESCEIKQLSLGVYLYFPAAFLLASNLLFFIITTYTLCRHSRQTQLATKSLERHHQSVQLFAKLFFVMGVTRVFEVITWAGQGGPTLTWYWALFDIFNVLQAVAIFIIYVCKQDVLHSLKAVLFRNFNYGGRKFREQEDQTVEKRYSNNINRASSVSIQSHQSKNTLTSVIDISSNSIHSIC